MLGRSQEGSVRVGEAELFTDSSNAEKANRKHWDEIAPVHLRSYGIEGLLSGISRIDSIQKEELYPISGKDLIHLQCHIGTDSLSLALDGAKVTGVDFSGKSIAIARDLSARMNLQSDFIEANVLDLYATISKKFDIVYTSKGVICWISDLQRWAETISFLLKDNGIFYMMETHPIVSIFDDAKENDLEVKSSYFHQNEPTYFDDESPDYDDDSYIPKNKAFEWRWSIADIVNALIERGLTIELLNEHDKLFYKAFPGMTQTSDGWWILKKYEGMIPLTFSLRAKKANVRRSA
jgi:SAM-dependent methyltransferase